MPKTKLENVVFTIIMATIMVYGMIVYNVTLNMGEMTNQTFLIALHEMPIMVPIAVILELFVVGRLAGKLAFSFMRPTDRPMFIILAISTIIVCIMCPTMSLIATFLFKKPSFATWIYTFGCNMPMALIWQLCFCGPITRQIFKLIFRRGVQTELRPVKAPVSEI